MVSEPQSPALIVRGATILTMNDAFDVIEGDVLIRDGRIVSIGRSTAPRLAAGGGARVIDANGSYLLPGFIQTHIHLCQTLFRGYADDLALLDWLKTRIWPMEAAHNPRRSPQPRNRPRPSCCARAPPPC